MNKSYRVLVLWSALLPVCSAQTLDLSALETGDRSYDITIFNPGADFAVNNGDVVQVLDFENAIMSTAALTLNTTGSSFSNSFSPGDFFASFDVVSGTTTWSTGEFMTISVSTQNVASEFTLYFGLPGAGAMYDGSEIPVTVTASAVPEPSTYTLFAGLACLIVVWVRNRSQVLSTA